MWPVHSEKKMRRTYFVLNRLLLKVSAEIKLYTSLIFIDDCSVNILIIGL